MTLCAALLCNASGRFGIDDVLFRIDAIAFHLSAVALRFSAVRFNFSAVAFRFAVVAFCFAAVGFRFVAVGFRFAAVGFRFAAVGFRFVAVGFFAGFLLFSLQRVDSRRDAIDFLDRALNRRVDLVDEKNMRFPRSRDVPAMSSTERSRLFRERHPGYYRGLRARKNAGYRAAVALQAQAQVAVKVPLALPAPVVQLPLFEMLEAQMKREKIGVEVVEADSMDD